MRKKITSYISMTIALFTFAVTATLLVPEKLNGPDATGGTRKDDHQYAIETLETDVLPEFKSHPNTILAASRFGPINANRPVKSNGPLPIHFREVNEIMFSLNDLKRRYSILKNISESKRTSIEIRKKLMLKKAILRMENILKKSVPAPITPPNPNDGNSKRTVRFAAPQRHWEFA
jgi:hypothetical protein